MADKPIGQLPVSAGLDDASLLVTEQGGEARSITGALVKQFAKDAVAEEVATAKGHAAAAAEAAGNAERMAESAYESMSAASGVKDQVDEIAQSVDDTYRAVEERKTQIDEAVTNVDASVNHAAEYAQDAQNAAGEAKAAQNEAGNLLQQTESAARSAETSADEAGDVLAQTMAARDEAVAAASESVKLTAQSLTDEQKAQARANIGAPDAGDIVQSDLDQNDEAAPDYVKGRKFFDKGGSSTVKWNGATSNLVSITVNAEPALNYAGETYYLMPRTTDKVPPAATLEALGGSYTYQTGAEDMGENGFVPELGTVAFGAGQGNLDSTSYPGASIIGDMVIVVHEANTALYDITVEKPGVYFRKYFQSPNFYQTMVTEMTLAGGVLDDGLERLPGKFLPKGVAMESYVDEKVDELAPVWLTLTNSKLDRTMNELKTLFRAGRAVKLFYNGTVFDLTDVGVDTTFQGSGENQIVIETPFAVFTSLSAQSSSPMIEHIRVSGSGSSYGTVNRTYQTYPLTKAGGTMTGALTLSGDPTSAKHAATKQYVDEAVANAGGSGGGALYVAFSSEDGSTYTADKTFAEIEAAYSSGGVVIGQISTLATTLPTLVPLTQVYPGMGVIFSAVVFPSSGSTAHGVHVMVAANNAVAVSHYAFEVTKV